MLELSKNRSPASISVKNELRNYKRERILEEAGKLFYERGYHKTTLEAIAESLGVTKPFIYSYYKNKTALLTEIYSRVVQFSQNCITQAKDASDSPLKVVEQFVQLFVQLAIKEQAIVAVYFQESVNMPAEALNSINELKREFDLELTQLIQEGIDVGEFTVEDPQIAGFAITGMISWIYTWYQPGSRLSATAISDRMVEYTLELLGARHR